MENLNQIIDQAIPSFREIILIFPVALLIALGAAVIAAFLKIRKNVKTAYTRKVFHFLIFSAAFTLQYFEGLSAVIVFGCVVSILVLYTIYRGDGFPFYEALARPADRPRRALFILVPLITTALGGIISNLFFFPFAMVGYLVGGLGDAVGEPAGAYFGKNWYKVPSLAGVPAKRSIEGSLAVFTASFAAAVIALYLMDIPNETIFLTALTCALISAAVEAISTHGLDNLTIQVAASATAYMLLS